MSVSKAVGELQSHLAAIQEHLPLLDDAKKKREGIDAEIKAASAARDNINQQVKTLKDSVEAEKIKAAQAAERDRDLAARALKDVQDRHEATKAELEKVSAAVELKRKEHDQILASLDSLRKKLA